MTDSNAHPQAQQAAAYALGTLDPDEQRALEAHLSGCTSCRQAVDEYRAVTELLAYGVPAKQPPPELRDRVLQAARASAPRGRGTTDPERPVRRGRSAAVALLAAASVVLASVTTIGYVRERQARDAAEAELARTTDELARVTDELSERQDLVETFLGAAGSAARLTSAEADPSIRLFWNQQRNSLLVAAFGLPPAGAGRTYQLWGIPEGQPPVSLGTFNTDASGQTTVVLEVPAEVDVADSDVSAVTDEPAGGSPQPTTTPFLVGSWEHAR